MSVSSENKIDWVYRIFDRRTVSVKAKNEQVRKIAAADLLTSLPFSVDVPPAVPMGILEIEKAYFASLKVYTARNIEGIVPEHVEFFEVLDVDQSIRGFYQGILALSEANQV